MPLPKSTIVRVAVSKIKKGPASDAGSLSWPAGVRSTPELTPERSLARVWMEADSVYQPQCCTLPAYSKVLRVEVRVRTRAGEVVETVSPPTQILTAYNTAQYSPRKVLDGILTVSKPQAEMPEPQEGG